MLFIAAILIFLVALFIVYLLTMTPTLPADTDKIIESVMQNPLPELIRGQAGYARSGDIQIWYECIPPEGTPKGTVMLMMGIAGDGLIWDPPFMRAFLEAGYQVIRYDHRGTGMSDWMAGWKSDAPYTLQDMAGDAAAVLDALAIPQAHVFGLSMGGMIAQELAIHYRERVASLTLMMTTGFVVDPELPGLTSRYFWAQLLMGLPLLRYRLMGGEKNLIKERLAKVIQFTGADGLNIQEMAELVLYDLRKRRGINVRALFQHQAAVNIAESRYEALKTLDVPVLVIHGTDDALLPVEHGRKLVELIPGAKALWLEGVGHVFPPPNLDAAMRVIIAHLDSVKPHP
jgi:pimeloyl-ACP methyl ester carboxylesterase